MADLPITEDDLIQWENDWRRFAKVPPVMRLINALRDSRSELARLTEPKGGTRVDDILSPEQLARLERDLTKFSRMRPRRGALH